MFDYDIRSSDSEAALIDIFKMVRNKWYSKLQYRNKKLRMRQPIHYGFDFDIMRATKWSMKINIFVHRYALFFEIGQRYV